jgi:E1A/CREB-binding protein
MQRIKRFAPYFTDRTKQNHWCEDCYNALSDDEAVPLDDGSEVKKKDLQEFKNDAVPEEGWVNCDECKAWVHQICALFNGRTNKSDASYMCPNCYLARPESTIDRDSFKPVKLASDLAECSMSMAIEKGLAKALETAYSARAKELGLSVENVEKANGLVVRVLANTEKKHFVGEEVCWRVLMFELQIHLSQTFFRWLTIIRREASLRSFL